MVQEDVDDELYNEKINELPVSIFSRPFFRDFGLYFLALIKFDMFLGPVLYYHETSKGSEYIQNLLDIRRLAEIYAGFENNTIKVVTINDREIVLVSRLLEEHEGMETTTLFLVGIMKNDNLDEIGKAVQLSLNKSGGDPNKIAEILKNSILNIKEEKKNEVKAKKLGKSFKILAEERPVKSLNLQNIKGAIILDVSMGIADFRLMPQWVGQQNLFVKDFVEDIESSIKILKPKTISSIYHNNVHFVVYTADKNFFIFLYMPSPNPLFASNVGNWLSILIKVLKTDWKTASRRELHTTLQYLDMAGIRSPPNDFIEMTFKLLIHSDRIYPITNTENFELFSITLPEIMKPINLDPLKNLGGEKTISEIADEWLTNNLEVVFIMQWARSRNLISFLTSKQSFGNGKQEIQ